MTLEQGTLLNGRYRIVDILGQGGMGSVYRALDENLGLEVAVKENLFTTDEYSRQFRLEAVILASLRHQHLPRVTDHFVMDDRGQYLVMDYIEGEDLRQRMERMGTIPEEDAILIGAAVCDALAYLHTRKPPVLHRDIKPGNIKITPEGQVFLVDFGLAKLVQGNQTTTTGARAMTPGYSPPEQYGTARTDPRSDVYSLGATLYAALTGVIPEDGLGRVMDNVQLTPIRKHNTRISRRLSSAIEKAMEAYPDDRYQYADDFRRGLLNSSSKTQRFAELDLNISVPPPPESPSDVSASPEAQPSGVAPIIPVRSAEVPITSPKRRAARRRTNRLINAGIWFGVICLLFVGLYSWNSSAVFRKGLFASIPATPAASPTKGPESTPTQSLPSPVPTAAGTSAPVFTPTPFVPTPTPQGGGWGELAFVSTRTGRPQVYIMSADGKNVRPVTNEQNGACQPDWSPDGQKIVYISPCNGKQDTYQGASLYIMEISTQTRSALPANLRGDFDPAWSPDGKRIAFTSLRDGYMEIYMINLETNLVTRLTKAQSILTGVYAHQPAWNPFGSQVAYALKRQGVSQIWVTSDGDANLSKPNDQLVQSGNKVMDSLPVWSPDGDYILFNETSFDGTALYKVMSMRYEDRGTKQAVQLTIDPLPVVDVGYSPDGQWICFESWPDKPANIDIYIASISGANRTRLTTDPGDDFDPVWRPNSIRK
jgi:serine/threonine protein kinase